MKKSWIDLCSILHVLFYQPKWRDMILYCTEDRDILGDFESPNQQVQGGFVLSGSYWIRPWQFKIAIEQLLNMDANGQKRNSWFSHEKAVVMFCRSRAEDLATSPPDLAWETISGDRHDASPLFPPENWGLRKMMDFPESHVWWPECNSDISSIIVSSITSILDLCFGKISVSFRENLNMQHSWFSRRRFGFHSYRISTIIVISAPCANSPRLREAVFFYIHLEFPNIVVGIYEVPNSWIISIPTMQRVAKAQ